MNVLKKNWIELCKDKVKLMFSCATFFGFALVISFVVYGFNLGVFTSVEAFSEYIQGLGVIAPIVFIIVQAIQVIIPILPGAVGCAAGVVAFGGVLGFIYSYIGICFGSLGAFLIAKKFGMPIVNKLVNPKLLEKYKSWLEEDRKFDIMFAIAIFSPIAPDDLLCYLAGLTPMTTKKFAAIILLGKPLSISLYSLGLFYASSFLLK